MLRKPLWKRIARHERKVFTTAFVTSTSTIASFAANGVSPFPVFATFGIFGSILVTADFFNTVTVYVLALAVHDKMLRGNRRCCQKQRSALELEMAKLPSTSSIAKVRSSFDVSTYRDALETEEAAAAQEQELDTPAPDAESQAEHEQTRLFSKRTD